jgi:2'-5' RNA ligase
MRLFIGIELCESMRVAAAVASDDLRRQLTRAAPRAVLRWIDTSNLHITLWFLGEVADDRATAIRSALAAPFKTSTFMLRAAGAGIFPPSGAPRALWIGIQEGAASLVALYGELTERLAPLDFRPERRAYAPHLTVARFKDIPRPDATASRGVAAQHTAEAGACRIDAVTLYRSRLSPKGSQYEPLLRVPLS